MVNWSAINEQIFLAGVSYAWITISAISSPRSTNQKLEGDNSSLRTDVSHLQQERVGLGSKVTSLGTELAQATGECSRLKRELCEVQEFAEIRARQQVGVL